MPGNMTFEDLKNAVDSGNIAGHLIAVQQACLSVAESAPALDAPLLLFGAPDDRLFPWDAVLRTTSLERLLPRTDTGAA